MKKIKKIFFVTVGRSDYLRQLSIIEAIKKKKIKTKILISGSHSKDLFGNTIKDIIKKKISYVNCSSKSYKFESQNISKNISEGIDRIDKILKKDIPDAIILFGDRYEVLAAAIAGFAKNILIIHIHGGSVTFGSFDDQIRHSLTKLSHIHLTSTKAYAERICQLGEEKSRVHVVGAPALDFVKKFSKKINDKNIYKFIKYDLKEYFLVCFHSETTNLKNLKKQLDVMGEVLLSLKKKIIITYPNSDPGSQKIIKFFSSLVSKNKNMIFVKNLDENYYYVLKNCRFLIGNSSSGIVEAASFSIPVINLGTRQEGKIIPKCVFNCDFNTKKILFLIKKLNNESFRKKLKKYKNPYGNGDAGVKISKIISKIKIDSSLFQKKFIDL